MARFGPDRGRVVDPRPRIAIIRWETGDNPCERCIAMRGEYWWIGVPQPPLHLHCQCRAVHVGSVDRGLWDTWLRHGGAYNRPLPEWLWSSAR